MDIKYALFYETKDVSANPKNSSPPIVVTENNRNVSTIY